MLLKAIKTKDIKYKVNKTEWRKLNQRKAILKLWVYFVDEKI